MPATFYIVAPAENTPYMAWQARLFHYSCVTRVGAAPLIVVHGSAERELHPYFHDIARTGGAVCRAGSFRASAAGDRYAPRNTPGTLLSAAELWEEEAADDACFVLCDADMLFVRRPAFPLALTGDDSNFMDYGDPRVVAAAARLGVSPPELAARAPGLCVSVPHVIPAAIARPFGETWLDAIDLFPTRGYIDSMYAFGLAAIALELEVLTTRLAKTNFEPDAPADADMIHYAYGDDRWNKRAFTTPEQIAALWTPAPPPDSPGILGEIVRQLAGAREFYARELPAANEHA